MNEKIEKLVIESFFDESTNSEGQKMYTLGEEKIQKFAELIVKECMDQVRDEVQYITDYDKADQVVNVVKKHFGVE